MSSKLDEIEARYLASPKSDLDIPWLIARVRQIETALKAADGELAAIAESDATMGTVDIGHLCQAHDYLENALRESQP